MLKTYITTVPLQGKLDPMLYQRDHAAPPTATCFPIVQVMRDTLEPGDTVQLLAIRQENADTARNYQRLLEELTQLGIAEHQVRQIHLPEDQRPETLIGLCRDLVDALPQVTRVRRCRKDTWYHCRMRKVRCMRICGWQRLVCKEFVCSSEETESLQPKKDSAWIVCQ